MKEATLNKKVEHVNEIFDKFQSVNSILFVDYLGLTVAEVSDLRKQLHDIDCDMKVVKNNILRRAADKAGFEQVDEFLVGPSAVAFSNDATKSSKILFDFARKNDKLKIKAGVVEGKYMSKDELKVFATLPNKEGMIARLLSVLQAPIRNLACAVKAVAEKEQ